MRESKREIRIKSWKKVKISWHGTNEVGLRFTEQTKKKKNYSRNEIQWQIWQKLQIENGSFLNFWWWINWMDAVAYSSHSVNEPFLEVGWNLFMDSVWCILRAFQLRLFFFLSCVFHSVCAISTCTHTHSLLFYSSLFAFILPVVRSEKLYREFSKNVHSLSSFLVRVLSLWLHVYFM